MKNSIKRRLLSLLLAFMMVLSLAPTALLSGNSDTGTETDPPPETTPGGEEEDPEYVKEVRLGSTDPAFQPVTPGKEYEIVLEPNSASNQGARIEVTLDPDTTATRALHVTWAPANSNVLGVSEQNEGHVGTIYGKTAGKETVTVTAGTNRNQVTIGVTVSGIKPKEKLTAGIEIPENESVTITPSEYFELFGRADSANTEMRVSEVNGKNNIMFLNINQTEKSFTIQGTREGTATVRLEFRAGGQTYQTEFPVTVTSNLAEIPWTAGVSTTAPLKFSAMESLLSQKCQEMTGSSLASIIDLSVSTSQGIIYQGYKSPDDTGAGAGSSITYYASSASRGPYIKDLTFVPNASFGGEKATITFTGTAANGRTFKGRIEVTLTDAKTEDVTLTTRSDVPLKLKAEDFTAYCQAQTGASLSYVIFTLPPASQGVLYRDYKSELDYASKVTAAEQYDRKGLADITFVPAQGYVGAVTIHYAGYSTTGSKYDGELIIKVTRSLDENIQYQDYGSGVIAFSSGDFDAYSEAMTGYRMGAVSFTPPPASQGALYYNLVNGRGTPVGESNSFNYNQLNYLSFVAAEGFDGVVRIPFTGKDVYGTEFSGTAELHIQSPLSQNGDIFYTCQPSQSVKLVQTDFANLCQSVTGGRLYYVTFQALPDYTQGSLFYNRTSSGAIGSRVSTAAKYFNSAAPYLNNVSFWAGAGFSRVEIPFTIASVNGDTFTGLLVISSGAGAGNGRSGVVTYTTNAQQPVTFNGSKFDAASRQATNSALQYLRFSLPSSTQGTLYYDYREGASPRALDSSTALYLSGQVSVDKVTFVPASGFSGVCTVPFDGLSINGTVFQGTVEITVRAGTAYGSIVHYSTGGAPVHFQSYDLTAASGIGQPASIRLTGLPSSSQGRLYYQYSGVTKYSALGNTTVSYSVTGDPSIANLTFIPRAGYEGLVSIPYTATAADGVASAGSIDILVTLPTVSESFDDLGGCSAQTKSAVDYLSSVGVVNGTGYRTYSPGASILRGDFCLMVSRAFQFNVGGRPPATCPPVPTMPKPSMRCTPWAWSTAPAAGVSSPRRISPGRTPRSWSAGPWTRRGWPCRRAATTRPWPTTATGIRWTTTPETRWAVWSGRGRSPCRATGCPPRRPLHARTWRSSCTGR